MFSLSARRRLPLDPRRTWAPALLAILGALAGCATGGSSAAGTGGEGGTGATTATQGGGGEGGTVTDGGGGAGAEGGGGAGGTTTGSSTTSSSTTSSSTTTTSTTTSACVAPLTVAGYAEETEGNDLSAQADVLPDGELGFTAGLCPAGDIDVFAIPVTTAGASLRVEIKGMDGGCPPGAQTYLRVFTSSNALLAEDIDGGSGSCSLVSPTNDSGVASLEVGTYYVQVENLFFASVESYLVDVAVNPPSCGDGVLQTAAGEQCDDANDIDGDGCTAGCLVEAECGDSVTHVVAGEQCDDGNTMGGDGCSPSCVFEAVLLTESEPNTQATPDSLTGYDGAVGAISPAGDTDWFSFEVTVPGSTVTISTSNGLGDCPSGVDTEIYLFDPNGGEIANDDDDGAGSCSLIAPAADAAAQNLAAGTYTVKVEDFGNNGTINAYVLLVDVAEPGCGDGLFQAGEQCDDGNDVPGDGCSDTCQLEGNYVVEVEPNPLATPTSLAGYDGALGAIQPAGDQDVFTFDVIVPDSSVKIEVSNGFGGCPAGLDSELTLYGPGDAVLATDDDGGVSPCSKIDPVVDAGAKNLAPGTYKVMVKALFGASPQYVLSVKVQPPSCGDGIVASGEQCDDGDLVNGDGCSDLCATEPPWEIEPNDVLSSAVPPWAGFTHWLGSIQPMGDVDWYKITVQAGQTVTLSAHSVGNVNDCPFDMVMHLVGSNGVQIVEDDDDGAGLCPLLSPATDPMLGSLAPGAYYIWVQYIGNGGTGGPYQLNFSVQ